MKNNENTQINLLALLALVLIFSYCNNASEKNSENSMANANEDTSALAKEEQKIYTLPTPVQMVAAVSNENIKYDPLMLNPSQRNTNYSSNFSKALNMGIYCVDLGYTSFFDQKQLAINYLSTIKKLSDELGVLGAFDADMVKRFEKNINNRDTVIHLILDGFNRTHNFLVENKRNEIMILCFAGSYIEGLHISVNVAGKYPSQNMNRLIVEQYYYLDNLIKLLEPFGDKEEYSKLLEKLDELGVIYDNLNLPNLTGGNNDASKIQASPEQIKAIQEKIDIIRNEIIG